MSSEENTSEWRGTCHPDIYGRWALFRGIHKIALMPQQVSHRVENLQAAQKVGESWTLQGQIKELEARLDLLKQQLKEKEV